MSMSDPISDLIIRLKNAQNAQLISVVIPYSINKTKILTVLRDEGYIHDYSVEHVRSGIKQILVKLKYSKLGKPAIRVIERVSTPGKRFYSSCKSLNKFFNGMGIQILSTSANGVISDRLAKQYNIGGEIICRVF